MVFIRNEYFADFVSLWTMHPTLNDMKFCPKTRRFIIAIIKININIYIKLFPSIRQPTVALAYHILCKPLVLNVLQLNVSLFGDISMRQQKATKCCKMI